MAAPVYILPCDADIGRIGGGAWECPALGFLSETWENRNRKGKKIAKSELANTTWLCMQN